MTSARDSAHKTPAKDIQSCAGAEAREVDDQLCCPIEDSVTTAEEIEVQDDNGIEQEAEPATYTHNPPQVSDADYEAHRCDHYPYRSWCKFCVMSQGRGFPHSHGQESTLPVIGMDYFFMTATGIQKLEELEVDPNVLSEGALRQLVQPAKS